MSTDTPPHPREGRGKAALAVAAILAAVALAVVLRLADPLSSQVVPAEDPYTHMALVREHLRTGELDPLNAHETLYPPGFHGFLAAAAVLTGADLYGLTLYGPVVLGAIGVLGMGLLLWRTSGPVAGFVAALALAVAPEAIFRTTMMSPTALDLAVLPFLLYALLRLLAGRLGWAGVAAPMAVFTALAHPWLLAILCAAGIGFLVLALAFPWPAERGPPVSLMGAALCIAVLGAGLGLALTMPTFGFVLPLPDGVDLPAIGIGLGLLALLPAIALVVARRRGWSAQTLPAHRAPAAFRLAASAAIATALVLTWQASLGGGLPDFVDLPRMVGWPILALAFAALVALPFLSSPVASLAAGLVAATLPFVLFNPLDSEFLPHRTAVFLLLGLVVLAGVAAGAAAQLAARGVRAAAARRRAAPTRPSTPSRRPGQAAFATLAVLAVATVLSGSVYAGTPDGYEGGWYRLYNECEIDAFRDLAARADADPSVLLVTGDWQSKLVLAALTEDTRRVWFSGDVFVSPDKRAELVEQMEREGRPLVFVIDRHLRTETPDADLAFLASPPWEPAGSYCANMGIPQPRVTAYTTGGFP